jgi:hypothetical protein
LSPSIAATLVNSDALSSAHHLPKSLYKDFQDRGGDLQEVFSSAVKAIADIPEPVANILRPVGVAATAGVTVAAVISLPAITASGLGTMATIGASTAIGAVAGALVGQAIDAADTAIHDYVGETGNFDDTSLSKDIILGASLGLNISTMSLAHPLIEKSVMAASNLPFLKHAAMQKTIDLGMHALVHLGVDTGIETTNQFVQSVASGDNTTQIKRNIFVGAGGTLLPSLASTAVVESIEHAFPGARPLSMAILEGLEGSARQGNVAVLKLKNEDKPVKISSAEVFSVAPPATKQEHSTTKNDNLGSLVSQRSLAKETRPEGQHPKDLQAAIKKTLEETERFENIYQIVTERNRISPDSQNGRRLFAAYKDMKSNQKCLFSSVDNARLAPCLAGAETALELQADIYNQPGYLGAR